MLMAVRGPAGDDGGAEAGFPFGSGERHTQSVPFARALGLRWLGLTREGGAASLGCPTARLLLPCRPVACSATGALDVRALVALLDHAGAPACYGARAAAGATATLDLRIDLLAPPEPGADVLAETRCEISDGQSALVAGLARHAHGAPLARMSGRYVVGLGPGRANDARETPAERAANAAKFDAVAAPDATSFDTLLGLRADAAGDLVLEGRPWLVGSVALPALHGGVVAAGLVETAERRFAFEQPGGGLRLASLTLQFLRAGLAATDTHFSAHCVKAGARATYVVAEAWQQARTRHVATLQALFA